jgi:hypothetical protein
MVLQNAKSVTWIKNSDDLFDFALNDGLLRVYRNEYEKATFVSLGVETKDRNASRIAQSIGMILKHTQRIGSSILNAYEPEHRQQNGLLQIPRMVEARDYDKHVFSNIEKPLTHQKIGDKTLRLACATLGVLDTLEFVHDSLA